MQWCLDPAFACLTTNKHRLYTADPHALIYGSKRSSNDCIKHEHVIALLCKSNTGVDIYCATRASIEHRALSVLPITLSIQISGKSRYLCAPSHPQNNACKLPSILVLSRHVIKYSKGDWLWWVKEANKGGMIEEWALCRKRAVVWETVIFIMNQV